MEELKNKSSQLSNMPKENPFRVPDHYFDDFSARLQSKIEAEKIIVPYRRNRFIQIIKPALGLAASFALIFLLVYWPIKTLVPNKTASNQSGDAYISDMEYMNAIEEMDDYTFFALLNEPSNSSKMSTEDIANYLQANSSEYEIYAETHY